MGARTWQLCFSRLSASGKFSSTTAWVNSDDICLTGRSDQGGRNIATLKITHAVHFKQVNTLFFTLKGNTLNDKDKITALRAKFTSNWNSNVELKIWKRIGMSSLVILGYMLVLTHCFHLNMAIRFPTTRANLKTSNTHWKLIFRRELYNKIMSFFPLENKNKNNWYSLMIYFQYYTMTLDK